tara:strand:+ start:466 stop:1140 length:675 start_codon:yes stop_codon:yes gene_type:complete
MISWLKGRVIQKWNSSAKEGVVLDVGGVGYEIQLLSKQISTIDPSNSNEFWIHQINREDCTYLFGFKEISQRDLFRKVISVNGIGPQIGMALLEDLEPSQIVEAILESDINLLTKSQGIGKRIGERLIVELKNKLQKIIINKDSIKNKKLSSNSEYVNNYFEEIKSILNSLGYTDIEIKDSMNLITTKEKENIHQLNSLPEAAKAKMMDNHLKEILMRLSQNST